MTVAAVAPKPEVEWLGWKAPDRPDIGDDRYLFGRMLADELVSKEELPPRAAPQRREVDKHGILDQGPTGSCTGHGVGLIAAVERNVTKRAPYFIYYEARRIIGETGIDEGAYIRDAIKVVANLGSPTFSKWPSKIDKLFLDPSDVADRDAAKRKVFSYHRLMGGLEFRSCLASGHLFTIGFMVYPNIDDPLVEKFGILPLPTAGMRPDGGHCVAVIGYDDDFRNSQWAQWARNLGYPASQIPERVYECQNSWGVDWGNGGRFVIDSAYLEHWSLAGDAWTLRGFEDERR